MNRADISSDIAGLETTQQIIKNIEKREGNSIFLRDCYASYRAFLISSVYKEVKGDQLILANDKESAAYIHNDLQSLNPKKEIYFLPDSFKKVGKFEEIDNHNLRFRTEVIKNIVKPETKGNIIVTYPEAIMEQVIDQGELNQNTLIIEVGKPIDIEESLNFLVDLGFESTDFVYEPGQFSQRGGIVDIFSYGNDKPFRIELFGNDVESLRVFDPMTQESEKKIKKISIIPNIQGNFGQGQKVSLFEILDEKTVFWFENAQLTVELLQAFDQKVKDLEDLKSQLDDLHPLKTTSDDFFTHSKEIISKFQQYETIDSGTKPYFNNSIEIDLNIKVQPVFNRNFDLLTQNLLELQNAGYTLTIASENSKQHERFIQIFEDLDTEITFHPLLLNLHQGFINEELKLVVYTDHQIFERFHKFKLKKGYSKSEAINLKTLLELTPGDYVTHIDHGVGEFSGLQTIDVNGKKQEAVRLIYKDNDILYVGINALYKIAKFSGQDGKKPKINKLGSDAWQNLKRKTKKKVKDIANDLIRLYAKRKASPGFAFSEDTYLQLELESSFIYEDTPDQEKTTIEVKEDMEKAYPMDRLVCGDVGFGKTEIAMRAAFKAVADSKQVAILVPTTILALQHYKSFKERFADFPCTIDYINRFKTAKEKRETLERLKNGEIDIIVGTHALTSKNVEFKDLGLLIIDEEQKFGVSIKEKLRKIKANVDTLTLTATPIPRTLQFSLMGARDLSIMRTPPPNRQPITTEVKVFNEQFLKEAIEFEVYRGGQVFFVHNRVKDIMEYAGILQRIMPEMKIGIAHGQMEGHQLEKVLIDFIEKRLDILLCTNIIEAGLDIPNANTMIVNNAHQFGLSDLHQLRGRVGRSNKKAFCYLLSPPLSTMSSDSRKRLQTLEQFSDLGSGFHIAMRDLDIRGAGNILGAEQSGFISEIGMETFHKILDEAVNELKQTEYKDVFAEDIKQGKILHVSDTQVDTDVEMRIPDEYVNSRAERMLLYQELNAIDNEQDLNAFGNRLNDRFGPIPDSVYELFDALRLQWIAKRLGIERIIMKNGQMRCFFLANPDSPFYESDQFGKVLAYIQENPNNCQLKQSDKNLSITFKGVESMKIARTFLHEVQSVTNQEVSILSNG